MKRASKAVTDCLRALKSKYALGDLTLPYFLLMLAVIAVPFLVISFFNNPSADDYYQFNSVARRGFAGFQSDFYLHWSGRYASVALIAAFHRLGGLVGSGWMIMVKLFPVLLLLLVFCSFWYAVRQWTREYLTGDKSLILAIVIFLTCLVGLPSLPEGLYWFSSAVTYTTAAVFLPLFLGYAKKMFVVDRRPLGIVDNLVLGGLLFVIFGLNEIVLVVMAVILPVLLTVFARKTRDYRTVAWLTAVSVASVYLTVHAPGNYVRLGSFHGRPSFLVAGLEAFRLSLSLVRGWLTPALVVGSAMTLPLFVKISKAARSKNIVHPLIVGGYLFLMFYAAIYFDCWIASGPAPRVLDLMFSVFVLAWFVWEFALVDYLLKKYGLDDSRLARFVALPDVLLVSALVFFATYLCSPNVTYVLRDLAQRAHNYDQTLVQRRNFIEKMKREGNRDLEVARLDDVPATIFFSDITPDPDDWTNRCYAEFFGLNSIRTR